MPRIAGKTYSNDSTGPPHCRYGFWWGKFVCRQTYTFANVARGFREEAVSDASPIYFDCAATTAVDERVAELVTRLMVEEFGNAGSRTHEFGSRAKKAADAAREQIAGV